MKMRFIGVLSASLLCFGAAYAQAPVQTRGGGIQGQAKNSTWTIGPDGIAHFAAIDPTTVISGVNLGDLVTQLNAALTGVQNAVAKSEVGIVNGVAGLDASGNVTAPLNTPGAVVSLGTQQWGLIKGTPVLANDTGVATP
ncbi:hypothetical protein [Gluconobacter morbifer]|uniref:Uncharacterized protein n=1 Tax=Gluconobacter morbifer G707 TaxID=1088869 RepID=G6XH76_9PROT|nr:hypothetical protein [Gluconobacter morbifer]EHH69534.1 hypothetical protein GMO_08420 [Gluconobacter morbifer G707]